MRTFPEHNYWGNELGSGLTVLQLFLPVLLALAIAYGYIQYHNSRQQQIESASQTLRKNEKTPKVTKEEFQLYLDHTKRELEVITQELRDLRMKENAKRRKNNQ